MTDEPHLTRFLVRRGTEGFMVFGQLAVSLTEDHAHELKDLLTKKYIAEG
jgi:hypothetical protein